MPERDEIIKRLVTNTAEIITEEEFKDRLAGNEELTHYIGFEISGYVHIGQGIMSALVMKDLTDLGVKCTVWLADLHTWINEKLDGTKETAANIGTGYFKEAISAAFLAVGGDPTKLEFRLASSFYDRNAMQYWETVMNVAKHTTLARMQRSISIMGRQEQENVDFAKLLYPAMQVADVFFQKIDIAHSGMDQRKAHVIMRDVAGEIAPGQPKPIALHHPLLIGLQKPPVWPIPEGTEQRDMIADMKMSKSKPDSAIWIHDEPAEIERKLSKAFCPEKEISYNPVLNWVKHILSWNRSKPFVIERKEEHGGNSEYATYQDLETAYASGEIHPMDLKSMVTKELIELLAPAREHFDKPDVAAKKDELDKVFAEKAAKN